MKINVFSDITDHCSSVTPSNGVIVLLIGVFHAFNLGFNDLFSNSDDHLANNDVLLLWKLVSNIDWLILSLINSILWLVPDWVLVLLSHFDVCNRFDDLNLDVNTHQWQEIDLI